MSTSHMGTQNDARAPGPKIFLQSKLWTPDSSPPIGQEGLGLEGIAWGTPFHQYIYRDSGDFWAVSGSQSAAKVQPLRYLLSNHEDPSLISAPM